MPFSLRAELQLGPYVIMTVFLLVSVKASSRKTTRYPWKLSAAEHRKILDQDDESSMVKKNFGVEREQPQLRVREVSSSSPARMLFLRSMKWSERFDVKVLTKGRLLPAGDMGI